MKLTKIYKGEETEWYGFQEENFIAVNIQLLWEDFPNEDDFIKEFSSTYTHELLHDLLDEILFDNRIKTEEKLIRFMLDEPYNEELKEWYDEQHR